jgi:hypothetical protein
VPTDEILRALDDLVRRGLVRYIDQLAPARRAVVPMYGADGFAWTTC